MVTFEKRLDRLKNDLVTQGSRVHDLVLRAVECYFDRDVAKATEVIEGDAVIDRADVDIERASIPLLAMGETDEHRLRSVLTIVKINNELERIADCAVNVAEVVVHYAEEMTEQVPATFRVMANSVIGMLRDSNRALSELNVDLAQQVLGFDDTVDRFKGEIGLHAERDVASGLFSVSFAFRLRTVTAQLERIADHCTNICEQVIYLESGKIVRHRPEGWGAPGAAGVVMTRDLSSDQSRMSSRLDSIRRMVEAHGQAHLLRFVEAIDDEERESLLDEVEAIDFADVADLIERYVRGAEPPSLPDQIEPAPYYAWPGGTDEPSYDVAGYRSVGEERIRQGKIAAFTVAGGQGTRLGWRGPKGTYPATAVTGKPLFRCFAEQILAAERKYRVTIPWYIMTSPGNDADTRGFFLDNNCFGLVRKNIIMFTQGTMPAIDASSGKLLLTEPHAIAMSPDGHGGSIKALRGSGAVEDMKARGVEHISYFQVDNPLVRAIDPLFIGLHVAAPDSSAQMSSKMVRKIAPEEKVGVLCRQGGADGKTVVIEYSDLPVDLAETRDGEGGLLYNAGSIAIHMIGVDFVEKLTTDAHGFALPYHRALKKVEHVDPETGERVVPDEANAVKLETFVFDALPLAESSIVMETDRTEEYAPIKNATGIDSPSTSHRRQSDRAGRWLEAHGVSVPRDGEGHVAAQIEIGALTALEAADLVAVDLPERIAAGEELLL